jgi:hypothetical protein
LTLSRKIFCKLKGDKNIPFLAQLLRVHKKEGKIMIEAEKQAGTQTLAALVVIALFNGCQFLVSAIVYSRLSAQCHQCKLK